MKIAICDDIKEDLACLKADLKELWQEAEIDTYESGTEVVRQIQQGTYYDLIFLDIFMKQENGIEIGKEIRQFFPGIELVYVSNSREFGPEVYELNALHYLVKPYRTEALKEIKRRFLELDRKRTVVCLGREQKQEVPYHMITYIESAHNNLMIHLITGSVLKIRDSIQGFMEKLDERFLRINRGVIVNMEAIERMNGDSCEIGGITFMLSRRERAENRRRYNDWLFKIAMGGKENEKE